MPINGKPTYYEFFNLENFETDMIKIKSAYRSMALKWHPDRNDNKEDAERMMKQVNEIWGVFSNSKNSYDQYLKRKLGIQPDPLKEYGRSPLEDWYWNRENRFKYDFSGLYEDTPASIDAVQNLMRIEEVCILIRSLNKSQLDQTEVFIKMMKARGV